jgi:hypothetical protein
MDKHGALDRMEKYRCPEILGRALWVSNIKVFTFNLEVLM